MTDVYFIWVVYFYIYIFLFGLYIFIYHCFSSRGFVSLSDVSYVTSTVFLLTVLLLIFLLCFLIPICLCLPYKLNQLVALLSTIPTGSVGVIGCSTRWCCKHISAVFYWKLLYNRQWSVLHWCFAFGARSQ